jgi:hypothetical protein
LLILIVVVISTHVFIIIIVNITINSIVILELGIASDNHMRADEGPGGALWG